VGITGEGVLYPRTVPRIDGHSSTSFHGLDVIERPVLSGGKITLPPKKKPVNATHNVTNNIKRNVTNTINKVKKARSA
jgi:hypothetical protein